MEDLFLKNITILIADDSEQDLKIISGALSKYFNKVYTASNGLEALELYEAYKDSIDIIISDIEMPKLNGVTLLQKIRQSDMNLPFLIVSATFNQDILIKAINLNVTSFLPKPINLIKLLEKIDLLCEKKYFEFKNEQRKNEIENYLESVNSVALIYKMKADGDIIYMNETMLDISGYKEKDLDELYFDDIIHPDIPKKYIDETWEHIKSGKLWKGNTKFISKQKEVFYLNNTVFKLVSEDDIYITIAFLTTQENLERRDFQKKVLLRIKEFNLKEYNYKKDLKELKEKNDLLNDLNITKDVKVSSLKSQVEYYEKELKEKELKYEITLKAKKKEIEQYIVKLKEEQRKNEKLINGDYLKVTEDLKSLRREYDKVKDENSIMLKKLKDYKEIFRSEKEA